jgi:hypothetical protein
LCDFYCIFSGCFLFGLPPSIDLPLLMVMDGKGNGKMGIKIQTIEMEIKEEEKPAAATNSLALSHWPSTGLGRGRAAPFRFDDGYAVYVGGHSMPNYSSAPPVVSLDCCCQPPPPFTSFRQCHPYWRGKRIGQVSPAAGKGKCEWVEKRDGKRERTAPQTTRPTFLAMNQ